MYGIVAISFFSFIYLVTFLALYTAFSSEFESNGITFSFLNVNLIVAITMIGITAFLFSIIGIFLGKLIGKKFEKKSEIIGGIVLILIGIKILLEHFNLF